MRQWGRHIHTSQVHLGSCRSKSLHFLHKLVTIYTQLPLQKKDGHPCSPRRQKIFTCSSVQQCWLLSRLHGPVSLAACFWGQLRLPVTGDGSLILRAMASSEKWECFWCRREGVKSSMPVSQHKMAFSKISASSVWGEGSMVMTVEEALIFPDTCFLLISLVTYIHCSPTFDLSVSSWVWKERGCSFYIGVAFFKMRPKWSGETK